MASPLPLSDPVAFIWPRLTKPKMTPSNAGMGKSQKHGMTFTKLNTKLAMLRPLVPWGGAGCMPPTGKPGW